MSAHDGSPGPVSTVVPAQPAPVFREPGTDVDTDAECGAAGLGVGVETLGLDEHPDSTTQKARLVRVA